MTAEDCRPAVKATGLGSTDNGKIIADKIVASEVLVDSDAIQADVNRAFENLNSTAKTMGLGEFATGGFTKEPSRPHTTLITQVDVHDVSPVNDTLYYALDASKLEGMDGEQFPEDGNITIQWSKVHGRSSLRKFTITIDYKESN